MENLLTIVVQDVPDTVKFTNKFVSELTFGIVDDSPERYRNVHFVHIYLNIVSFVNFVPLWVICPICLWACPICHTLLHLGMLSSSMVYIVVVCTHVDAMCACVYIWVLCTHMGIIYPHSTFVTVCPVCPVCAYISYYMWIPGGGCPFYAHI